LSNAARDLVKPPLGIGIDRDVPVLHGWRGLLLGLLDHLRAHELGFFARRHGQSASAGHVSAVDDPA
jgi:hypothetical protein